MFPEHSRRILFDFGQMGPSYSPPPPAPERGGEESRGRRAPSMQSNSQQLQFRIGQFPITGGISGNGTRSIDNWDYWDP